MAAPRPLLCELRNYRFHNCIGASNEEQADVYSGRSGLDGAPVAVRCVTIECHNDVLTNIQHELLALRNLNHANLQPLTAAFVAGHALCVVSPLMDYGSATDMMRAKYTAGLPEPVVAMLLRDVLLAVQYLHQRDVIHRAIRASHVLVSSTLGVRLAGLRHCTSAIRKNRRGRLHDMDTSNTNLLWLAPEILRQDLRGYGTKSDCYSVGITACELANGFPPFADMQPMQMLYEKLRGTTPRLLDSTTLPPDELERATQCHRSFSRAFHDFADLCLRIDVQERLSATELLEQSFIKQARKQKAGLPQLLTQLRPIVVPNYEKLEAKLPPAFASKAATEDFSQSDTWVF